MAAVPVIVFFVILLIGSIAQASRRQSQAAARRQPRPVDRARAARTAEQARQTAWDKTPGGRLAAAVGSPHATPRTPRPPAPTPPRDEVEILGEAARLIITSQFGSTSMLHAETPHRLRSSGQAHGPARAARCRRAVRGRESAGSARHPGSADSGSRAARRGWVRAAVSAAHSSVFARVWRWRRDSGTLPNMTDIRKAHAA